MSNVLQTFPRLGSTSRVRVSAIAGGVAVLILASLLFVRVEFADPAIGFDDFHEGIDIVNTVDGGYVRLAGPADHLRGRREVRLFVQFREAGPWIAQPPAELASWRWTSTLHFTPAEMPRRDDQIKVIAVVVEPGAVKTGMRINSHAAIPSVGATAPQTLTVRDIR